MGIEDIIINTISQTVKEVAEALCEVYHRYYVPRKGQKIFSSIPSMAESLCQEGFITQNQCEEISNFVDDFATLEETDFDGVTISNMVARKKIIVNELRVLLRH